MELFDRKSVSKFFKLLCNKDTHTDTLYNKSTSKVFTERTLDKWFSDKFIIYYNQNGYKEYLYILSIKFYGYGKVEVNYLDYSNPKKLNNSRIFTGNDDYYGEWCEDDKSKHLTLIEMFKLPKQEFTFVQINTKKLFKNGWQDLPFTEILEKYGENFVVESITYDKVFKIAKELETKDVKVYETSRL